MKGLFFGGILLVDCRPGRRIVSHFRGSPGRATQQRYTDSHNCQACFHGIFLAFIRPFCLVALVAGGIEMKGSILLLSGLLFFALLGQAGAECFIHNDSSGNSTHLCDDYSKDPINIGKTIDSVVQQAESTAPYQIDYGRDSYMSDFGDDTITENEDFGATDNPSIGSDF